MPITTRRAVREDIPWIMRECQEFSQFYGTIRPVFSDMEYGAKAMESVIRDHLVLIAEDASGPVGFIAGLISPHLFNPSLKVLTEILWWVSAGARRTRAGFLLLNDFIAWGKTNVAWIILSIEHKSPLREESILRRGFKPQERSYLMEVV